MRAMSCDQGYLQGLRPLNAAGSAEHQAEALTDTMMRNGRLCAAAASWTLTMRCTLFRVAPRERTAPRLKGTPAYHSQLLPERLLTGRFRLRVCMVHIGLHCADSSTHALQR